MGSYLILKKMHDKKTINVDGKGKATTYSLAKEHFDDTDYMGKIFAQHASQKLFQIPLPDDPVKSKQEILLEEIVKRVGVYAIFTELFGWKLTKKQKTDSEKISIQDKWLHASRNLPNISTYFSTELSKLISNSNQLDRGSRYSNYTRKLFQVHYLANFLKLMFPKEVAACEQVLNNITELKKQDQKIKQEIEKSKKYKKWKDNLLRKAKKNPKLNLGKNECPICHYDGTTEIKAGPLKGKIFPNGFKLQFKMNDKNYRYCPSCEYSEESS
jgi:hypothetical protein